jgi:hypothetical protein
MTKNIWLVILILLLTGSLMACEQAESKNPKNDIVGKWSCDGSKTILDISPDGKCSYSSEKSGLKLNGNSSGIFLDDTHILGVWEIDFPSYEIHIRGNKMVLRNSNGKELKCSRES